MLPIIVKYVWNAVLSAKCWHQNVGSVILRKALGILLLDRSIRGPQADTASSLVGILAW